MNDPCDDDAGDKQPRQCGCHGDGQPRTATAPTFQDQIRAHADDIRAIVEKAAADTELGGMAVIMGELMHTNALAQMMCFKLIAHGIVPPSVFADGIDEALHEWEKIAAAPGHGIPGALGYARGRMEGFLGLYRSLAATIAAEGALLSPPQVRA